MYEILRNFSKTHEVVSVYSNLDNTFVHLTGHIIKVTKNHVLIAHITEHGFYDGYIVKNTEDIYRVDNDGWYERKISTLYHLRDQEHNLLTKDDLNNDTELNILLLFCAKKNNKIISIEYGDTIISGFVSNYNQNKLFLCIVDENGQINGNTIIYLDTIQTISLDTDTEQDILILHQHL